jgi:hypothetical protein
VKHDSAVGGFVAKAEPGSPEFKAKVAEPVMKAVDAMPKPFRDLVALYGYIDVYRAWRAGWTVDRIKAAVDPLMQTFDYPG